jgi:glycosyltransferase involved in cell wall biosynthesis
MSDAPTSPTGLGRICRELAIRIHHNMSDVFRVGTLGFGGGYSQRLPYPQYSISSIEKWTVSELPNVWMDFAGGEKGVLSVIWNPGWVPWLADPSILPDNRLKAFLQSEPFQRWGYFPLDAEGPNGKLTEVIGKAFSGFDRSLAYVKWAAELVDRTIHPATPTEHLPHGIDGTVFYPRDKAKARDTFVKRVAGVHAPLDEGTTLIGAVGTNTPRKNFPLAFQTCSEILKRGENVGLWIHTNRQDGAWDLATLAIEYGMKDRVVFSRGYLGDDDLAWAYSACDATLSVGSGEGFGYAGPESLACGVPSISGDYAAAVDLIPEEFRVKPIAFTVSDWYCNNRPVYDPRDWADKVIESKGKTASLYPELYWENLWPRWEKWLLAGVK